MDGARGVYHPDQEPSPGEPATGDLTNANSSTASLLDLLQGLALAAQPESPIDSEDESSSLEPRFSADSATSVTEDSSGDPAFYVDVDVAASTAAADGAEGLEFLEEYRDQLADELAGCGYRVLAEADKPARMAELVQEFGKVPESAGAEILLAEVPGTNTS
jgi:hypothetical protein